MDYEPCHADDDAMVESSPRDRAKAIILDQLGVGRVAAWCGCSADAVYQWLSRGTDNRPIPPERAITIIKAALAEGVTLEGRALWPGMPVFGASAAQPAEAAQ